jgi:hypothetical protein
MTATTTDKGTATMKIENPNATDLNTLRAGETVRINGKSTAYTVEGAGQAKKARLLIGPRGGVAFLVPSVGGESVQLSKGLGASNKRDWIRTLDITPSAAA